MNSALPKVLHGVLGIPLVEHVVRAALAVDCERVVLVANPDNQAALAEALAHHPQVTVAIQTEPKGTAHAVLAAKDALDGFSGTAVVLCGDAPCVSPESLATLLAEHREAGAELSLLSGRVADPTGYGRIVRDEDGALSAIVEQKDTHDAAVLATDEINSGTFAFELPSSWDVLAAIEPSASTGELYVTHAVPLSRQAQAVTAAGANDVLGVNDRLQLAAVTAVLRERINHAHMRAGVTIVDPASTFIDARAQIEADVRLEPFVVIQGACRIERGAVLGPFTHVRGDSTVVAGGSRVGNFVEVVRSRLGKDSRALHLSYVGDGELGEGVNVGAGTIFANWDGQQHHRSTVEAGASLGANTVLVAPTRIGAGARTGAGAVVVKTDVPAGATYVGVPAAGVRSEK